MHVGLLEDTSDRIEFFKKLFRGNSMKIATTPEEMIGNLIAHTFDVIFLDHDLGGAQFMKSDENSGFAVAEEMVRNIEISSRQRNAHVYIHSQNPVGAQEMYHVLKKKYFTVLWPITAIYSAYHACDLEKGFARV